MDEDIFRFGSRCVFVATFVPTVNLLSYTSILDLYGDIIYI